MYLMSDELQEDETVYSLPIRNWNVEDEYKRRENASSL